MTLNGEGKGEEPSGETEMMSPRRLPALEGARPERHTLVCHPPGNPRDTSKYQEGARSQSTLVLAGWAYAPIPASSRSAFVRFRSNGAYPPTLF